MLVVGWGGVYDGEGKPGLVFLYRPIVSVGGVGDGGVWPVTGRPTNLLTATPTKPTPTRTAQNKQAETDAGARRNAFLVLCQESEGLAITFLAEHLEDIPRYGDGESRGAGSGKLTDWLLLLWCFMGRLCVQGWHLYEFVRTVLLVHPPNHPPPP